MGKEGDADMQMHQEGATPSTAKIQDAQKYLNIEDVRFPSSLP
jgi:hypothetical protein